MRYCELKLLHPRWESFDQIDSFGLLVRFVLCQLFPKSKESPTLCESVRPNRYAIQSHLKRFNEKIDSLFDIEEDCCCCIRFHTGLILTSASVSFRETSAYILSCKSVKDVGVHWDDHDVSAVGEARASALHAASASDAGCGSRAVHLSRREYPFHSADLLLGHNANIHLEPLL